MVQMESENKELSSRNDFAAPAHDLSNSIILHPFAHQVGGHTQLLTLDKSTLCKPLVPRELLFYLNIPTELVNFVPAYKGVVQIRETSTGHYPSVVCHPLRSPQMANQAKYRRTASSTLPAKFRSSSQPTIPPNQLDCPPSPSSSPAHHLQQHHQLRPSIKPQLETIGDSANLRSIGSLLDQSKQPKPFDRASLPSLEFLPQTHNPSPVVTQNHFDNRSTGNTQQHRPTYTSLQPIPIESIREISADDEERHSLRSLDSEARASFEENSDHTNGGYFSEDSSHSATDLSSQTPQLELKVQIRECSDEKLLKKNLSQDNLLRADYISRPNAKYLLLLENVASKYQLPCILDLKMGTRQHGDDASDEKRHRQIAKCQASTSASLGVRLCGMQVYQSDCGGFLWYDKYYGRKMDEEGLKRALHQYFLNGFRLNEDIIDDVIARLRLLSVAVEKSSSFRFYGTSLLIIHEGCTSRSLKRCPVDVRLIDFAHTICDYSNPATFTHNTSSMASKSQHNKLRNHPTRQLSISSSLPKDCAPLTESLRECDVPEESSDTGECVQQVSTRLGSLTTHDSNTRLEKKSSNLSASSNISVKTPTTAAHPPTMTSNKEDEDVDDDEEEEDEEAHQLDGTQRQDCCDISSEPETSNHATRKSSKNSVGSGPDKGLLFGLKNLMRLLDDLKSQYRNQIQEEDEPYSCSSAILIPEATGMS